MCPETLKNDHFKLDSQAEQKAAKLENKKPLCLITDDAIKKF